MPDFIVSGEGNFFYQLERAVPFEWLTCTGVGDIDVPMGDRTPDFCPDPLNSGKFKIDGFIRGDPAAGTYRLTKPLVTVYNFLVEEGDCDMVGRVNWVCRGTREDVRNYEVAVLMIGSEPSRKGIANPVRGSGDADARVMTNQDLSFMQLLTVYPIRFTRQTVTNDDNANDVYFLPKRCEDRCGAARGLCEVGVIGLDNPSAYLYTGNVKKTENYGAAWGITVTNPFPLWGSDISAILMVETLAGSRIIAFTGETAPVPPRAAYSDNMGATWIQVNIGIIANTRIIEWCFVGAKILVTTNTGYIYSSMDQAETWDIVEAGVETAGVAINDIASYARKYVYGVSLTDIFLRSIDSGVTFDNITTGTPFGNRTLLSVAVNDKGHVFVGTNDGRLWVNDERGIYTGWVQVINLGGGTIDWIGFDPKAQYVGMFIWNNVAGVGSAYRTEDGGASWREIPDMPVNTGLNAGFMCDENNYYVVGDIQPDPGGTTFIARSASF